MVYRHQERDFEISRPTPLAVLLCYESPWFYSSEFIFVIAMTPVNPVWIDLRNWVESIYTTSPSRSEGR